MLEEGKWSLDQAGKHYTGRMAMFEYVEDFAGGRRQLQSEACLLRLGANVILYRITYPSGGEAQRIAHSISEFQSKPTLPVVTEHGQAKSSN